MIELYFVFLKDDFILIAINCLFLQMKTEYSTKYFN